MRTTAPPRRYLVTGGTSGIGLACAVHLAAEGARVWITGTRRETADAALEAGAGVGGSVCDVTSEADVDAAVDDAVAALGGLDGVFANAGVDGQGRAACDLDVEHFRHVLDVNVLGAYRVARAAHRALARPGVLVVNASVNALRPEVGFADYNVSKAAALALVKSLALEWSREGLSVVGLCPGYFPSRMTAPFLDDESIRAELLAVIPAGRFGELAEVARTTSFLLSGAAPYLTGATITLDGGRSA